MSSIFQKTGEGIAAAVILYKPDIDSAFGNMLSYLPAAGRLYVIDNSDDGSDHSFLEKKNEKIRYIKNSSNLGIAEALNIAAGEALKAGFRWILTMDQDSHFEKKEMDSYLQQFTATFYEDTTMAIVSPSTEPDESLPVLKYGVHSITSGSIMQLAAWDATGGFENELFIDEVDEDYCCKVLAAGYQVVRISNVLMHHKLGEKRRTGMLNLFFVKERTIHQPFRVYYMVRNYLYIRKRYGKAFPGIFKKRDKEFLTDLKNNILFSGNFIKAGSKALKGYWHFLTNRIAADNKKI